MMAAGLKRARAAARATRTTRRGPPVRRVDSDTVADEMDEFDVPGEVVGSGQQPEGQAA